MSLSSSFLDLNSVNSPKGVKRRGEARKRFKYFLKNKQTHTKKKKRQRLVDSVYK